MKHLFQDTEEITYFTDESETTDFERYKKYLSWAARYMLIPHIGKSFYEELVAFYQKGKEAELVYLAQSAVANFAALYASPRTEVVVTTQGIVQFAPSGQKVADYQKVDRLKANYETTGYQELDSLLYKLEMRCRKKQPDFPNFWKHHQSHFPKLFLRNADEFSEIVEIHRSRKHFMQLFVHLKDAHRKLKEVLGKDFYEALENQYESQRYGSYTEKLIEPIRHYLAHYAYARYKRRNYGQITATTHLEQMGTTGRYQGKRQAADKRQDGLIAFHEAEAKKWLQKVIAPLEANPQYYPQYTPKGSEHIKNKPTHKVVIL